ncbi:WG repeat-containing protein [Paenibacillus chartarius]|uniref:WG repeat-containing protein n=1 Tax=Paenibacillus chartarius TaxID=747481 RepID=A0ABV6DIL8_9BACL
MKAQRFFIIIGISILLAQLFCLSTVQAQESGTSGTPNFAIEPQYYMDIIGRIPFEEGVSIVRKARKFDRGWAFESGYQIVDRSGNVLTEIQIDPGLEGKEFALGRFDKVNKLSRFDHLYLVSDGMIRFNVYAEDNGKLIYGGYSPYKFGFINTKGELAVIPKFDDAHDFKEGMASVLVGDKYGFIDKSGSVVIQPQYDATGDFSEGMAAVQQGKKWGYVDKNSKEIVAPIFDDASDFSEGLAPVKRSGKWGYIDKSGNEVIPPQFDRAYSFNNGLALVADSRGVTSFINRSGTTVIYPKILNEKKEQRETGSIILVTFGEYFNFQEGYAPLRMGNKWGFIDVTGKIVIQPQYEDAGGFAEGLAAVKKNGKWGYIDKLGKEIIAPQFSKASFFAEGLAGVEVDGLWGYISNPLNTPSDWAKTEIETALSLKLIPDPLQFGYEINITRAEFSSLVVRLIEVKTGKSISALLSEENKTLDLEAFSDTIDPTILAAYSLGIVGGKGDGIFDPKGDITRQEAAVMLARTAKVLGISNVGGNVNYADDENIASWAKDSVSLVSSIKDKSNQSPVMGSTGNNNFSPKDSYTKQQAFITMKRLFNAN